MAGIWASCFSSCYTAGSTASAYVYRADAAGKIALFDSGLI